MQWLDKDIITGSFVNLASSASYTGESLARQRFRNRILTIYREIEVMQTFATLLDEIFVNRFTVDILAKLKGYVTNGGDSQLFPCPGRPAFVPAVMDAWGLKREYFPRADSQD